jgi:hypothetical protein
MSWRDLLYLVRRNLLRMKIRVAMTSIGVLIGTAAIILLVSLGAGLQRFALNDLGSIGELTEMTVFSASQFQGLGVDVQSSGESTVLNDETLRDLADLPGVVAVTPLLRASGELRVNRLTGFANIVGIEPRVIDDLGFEFQEGIGRLGQWQSAMTADWSNGPSVCGWLASWPNRGERKTPAIISRRTTSWICRPGSAANDQTYARRAMTRRW